MNARLDQDFQESIEYYREGKGLKVRFCSFEHLQFVIEDGVVLVGGCELTFQQPSHSLVMSPVQIVVCTLSCSLCFLTCTEESGNNKTQLFSMI
jgi:hypothetical protein